MAYLDRAVGIDLGTTNSEIAWLPPDEREIVIYADRFGRKTLPSAVAWDSKAEAFLVGHPARARRGHAPPPVESVKRKMGRGTALPVGPHALTPEEVSAKILETLRARMQETLDGRTRDQGLRLRAVRAVITVPAYFDAPQVEATRRAGELAGFEVVGILQEPTAAAIYHTWKRRLGDGVFLVYDLGGGTFDVSILRCLGGEYQVLALDGDNYLGGDDFDRRFAEYLRSELVTRGWSLELDLANDDADRGRFGRLVHLAQEIKESLSTTEVLHVAKDAGLVDKRGEPVTLDLEISRAAYEEVVGSLVETTLQSCKRALERAGETAGITLEDVDHVVLVGGATRVPLVGRRVTEAFRAKAGEPLRDEVDTCVALGAAIHAAHVGGTIVGTDDDTFKVRLTTPLVAEQSTLRLGLLVLAAPAGTAVLALWEGERLLAETRTTAGPARLDVARGADAAFAEPITLVAQSAAGAPLAELPLPLARGDLRPRPTALSRAAVLAKDLALEVMRSGRRDRKVLVQRGAGLPVRVTHLFFTGDQSGAVVLRLLQNRLPIKTLVLDVPRSLPVGSPVELVLSCDDAMRIEAHATVGERRVEAHMDPPELASSELEAVEALLDRAERARRALFGDLLSGFGPEADRLTAAIREVLHTDPDKLHALCQALAHLVDEVQGSAGDLMTPPLAKMEEAFALLRRIVHRQKGDVAGMPRPAWDVRIKALHEEALRAHDTADASVWRGVYDEVQALAETAYQDELFELRLDDPSYVRRRRASVAYRAERAGALLAELVTSSAKEVGALQETERARLVKWLGDAVLGPLARVPDIRDEATATEVRRALERIDAELERIEAASARVPSIGLVTDRGAGG